MVDSIGSALERAATQFASRTAIIDHDIRWTYRELRTRVAGFDTALDRLGFDIGDVVAVLCLNSAAHLLAWLAIPRSGRVLNDLNTRLASTELEFILNDCSARAIIVDDAFLELGRSLASKTDSIQYVIYAGAGNTPTDCLSLDMMTEEPAFKPTPLEQNLPAGIFYTGGTTGSPKGVVLTHRNLVANAKHTLIAFRYQSSDRYLHASPMFHLADGTSTYALTWAGGLHVTVPSFEPQRWAQTVAAERITHALLVPTMINALINDPDATRADLSSLRTLYYGGSPMPGKLLRAATATIPCRWVQAYGMTEAAPLVSCLSDEDHRLGMAGEEPHATRLQSAGRPVIGVDVEVRREDGTATDVGECGEVWVSGPNVMSGYWNRPKETADAFDLLGWYRTGDAAYVDTDGYLFIIDRVKDMIITGGENVYSTEVENALYQHPAVLECAVFGIPDDRWGELVHAAIVLRAESAVSAEAIVSHCRTLIAGYKVPRSMTFHDQALPKSGAGKVLKRQLRENSQSGQKQ